MTSLLTDNLPLLAGAPNGIKKLRELILELAVRGKLVEQDASDEPASALLKRIAEEKALLVAKGKIKKPKQQNEINTEETPFELPSGWVWQRLGSVANIFNGNSINSTEKESKFTGVAGRPYIATKDVGYGLAPLDYENGVRIPDDEVAFRIAHAGAVLLCAEGGSAGKKCGITDRDILFGNKLFATEVYGSIPPSLILYYFLTPTFRAAFGALMTGIIGGVSIAKFVDLLVPLPPLTEQHRIVAKVDELMALCDRLETQQADAANAHAQLVQALLDSLTQASGASDFATSWQRLAEHFHTLFTTEPSIDALKQTLLQLAVMGKLVPQDPTDEPASELLKNIQKDLCEMQGLNAIKTKERDGSVTSPENYHFQLPTGWIWCELQDIAAFYNGKAHEQFIADDGEFILVNSKFVSTNGLIFKLSNQSLSPLFKNDIAFVMSDVPNGRALARCYLIEESDKYTLNQRIGALRTSLKMNINFLINVLDRNKYYLDCDDGQKQTNLKKIQVISCPIPLPPLAEQHRIVAKVDQLMALCDQLKTQLSQARQLNEQLASTLVEQAVA